MSDIADRTPERPAGAEGPWRVVATVGVVATLTLLIALIAVAASPGESGAPELSAAPKNSTSPENSTLCRIPGASVWYPDNVTKNYRVSFNPMTRQPNFVVYRIPLASSNNTNSGWLSGDPYGRPVLNPTCYNAAAGEYDNGHLVPNIAFGRATYFMANAVPMRKGFNRGSWRVLEERVRTEYPNKVITIGCRYTGGAVNATYLRGCAPPVQSPSGCYYAVLDLAGAWDVPGELLDSGYYANTPQSTHEARLAPWIEC